MAKALKCLCYRSFYQLNKETNKMTFTAPSEIDDEWIKAAVIVYPAMLDLERSVRRLRFCRRVRPG